MIYTLTIFFVETTKLFISNSVRVYRYICEIFLLYVPRMRLLTPCFVPREGFLYTVIVPRGRDFASFKSCPGGIVLGEIDTCIKLQCLAFMFII